MARQTVTSEGGGWWRPCVSLDSRSCNGNETFGLGLALLCGPGGRTRHRLGPRVPHKECSSPTTLSSRSVARALRLIGQPQQAMKEEAFEPLHVITLCHRTLGSTMQFLYN